MVSQTSETPSTPMETLHGPRVRTFFFFLLT
jgi:hypothetical protein